MIVPLQKKKKRFLPYGKMKKKICQAKVNYKIEQHERGDTRKNHLLLLLLTIYYMLR